MKGSKCKTTCDPVGNIFKIEGLHVLKGAERKVTSWPLIRIQPEFFFPFLDLASLWESKLTCLEMSLARRLSECIDHRMKYLFVPGSDYLTYIWCFEAVRHYPYNIF